MGAVKVVNKATGEVIELPYDSFEDFAMQYDEVTQQIAALERAKKKMSTELKLMMGDERELPLANGWHFAKYTSTRKSYPVALVMELLEDDATRFLKVEKRSSTPSSRSTPRTAVGGRRSAAGCVRGWRWKAAPSR